MSAPATRRHLLMLGTFGFQPKATMRARALGLAQALTRRGWSASIATTPWDWPQDAGHCWDEGGVRLVNTRTIRPILWPLAVHEMLDLADAESPTLIHLFKPKGFGDLAARRLRRRLPIAVDMDDWEGDGGWNDSGLYGPLQRRLFNWQERTWPRQAAAVTAASRELERRALALGAPRERIIYAPNGLTSERFAELDPERRHGAGDEANADASLRILLYTRFVEFEPSSLARLIATVRQTFPTARLVIAGASADGRAEGALLVAATDLGVADAIEWLGWIDPSRISVIARGCALAIHPFDDTLLNRAKSSVKLLELMATELPVVTTAVGENAEVIRQDETGWLVPPADQDALATAVVDLLGDPARRRRLGARAREYVGRELLWERLVERVERAYAIALRTD